MKSMPLNVRIPASLREKLENDAQMNNVSLSDYTRDIITNHYINDDNENYFSGDTFYNSSDYIFLITWMFEKRVNPYDQNQKQVFKTLKDITLKIIKDDSFSYNLRQEFEKVFFDLTRFINEFGIENNYFRFCLTNYPESFNYYLLLDFTYKKAYENRI